MVYIFRHLPLEPFPISCPIPANETMGGWHCKRRTYWDSNQKLTQIYYDILYSINVNSLYHINVKFIIDEPSPIVVY